MRDRQGEENQKGGAEVNIAEEARIVPGAWKTVKKRHAARCAADSKYKRDYERNAERLAEQQTRSS